MYKWEHFKCSKSLTHICVMINYTFFYCVQNPIQLDCSHCVCKLCLTKNLQIYCAFCGIPSKRDLSEAHEST
jgi:hypothetical protein